jgi:flotillin
MVKYISYKQLFIYYESRKNEGVHMEINIGIIAIIVLAIAILAILASGYVKASPNKAYIISGIKREPKVLIGRAGIKIPFLEKKDELILKQISIDIKTNGYIPTKDFIGVDIDAVAKVRVLTQRDVTVNAKGEVVAGADANKRITTEMANAAMKNFLNMNEDQIRDALTDSLQGNMREIIGTQCLKELCNDRKTFGDEVQAKAQKDMNALGIWIESCNIQKIEDENNLITALGQDNMSQIQKDASVAKAQADRDVAIARAQAQKDANDAQVIAETEIAQKQTELAIKKAELKKESDIKKAEADAAYKIQEEEQRKTVEITTANANLARQEKELELKEREVSIKEKALEAEVKKTAEANKYAAQQKADAEQYERQKRAEAELFEIQRQAEAEKAKSEAERFAKEQAAEAVKAAGLAEAAAVAAKGKAEAEAIQAKAEAEAAGILKKAEAMKQYGDAARQQMELDTLKVYFEQLPKIAEAVAKGYMNVDSIKMFGGDSSKLAGDIMTTVTQVTDGIKESTGLDINEMLAKGFAKEKADDAKPVENVEKNDTGNDYQEV